MRNRCGKFLAYGLHWTAKFGDIVFHALDRDVSVLTCHLEGTHNVPARDRCLDYFIGLALELGHLNCALVLRLGHRTATEPYHVLSLIAIFLSLLCGREVLVDL